MVASGVRVIGDVQDAVRWLRSMGVRRLVVDSRQVRQGDAFVAWPGAAHDARAYAHQALAQGACACLAAAEGAEAFGFDDERIALMLDLKRHLGPLCSAFNGHPSHDVQMVAVTGTNGKTSTTWWLAQAIGLLGARSALVGTLGIGEPPVGARAGQWTPTGLTTPDPATLHGALAALRDDGVRRCTIEASSIGIAEQRLGGLDIRVAVFTNFTQDHLDYHGSMAAYWAAKRELFNWPTLRAAVVNVDDPQGALLVKELRARRPDLDLWPVSLADGARQAKAAGVRLSAAAVCATARGMSFELVEADGQALQVDVPFFGAYNVSNLLGVVAALRALGHGLTDILDVLPALSAVPGRMESFGGSGEPLALVDYAHTPDALEKALLALRPIVQARGGHLCCVFGCGGDRDRSKRPLMGSVAARLADFVVLTSDNPRSEHPERIVSDIRSGIATGEKVQQQVDRRLAINDALSRAGVHDVVLVAGKGHEDYQEIQGVRHPCRDSDLVREALAQRPAAGFLQLGDVATALRGLGELQGDPAVVIGRVHTDTRSIQAGDLYVALRGERFDGHDFLKQAHEAGAVAALAEQGLAEAGMPGVAVRDSLLALQALARDWRAQLQLPLIAVTGSNGKTTVTQMVASILRAWVGDRAGHTRGNLNNHIGVPLSVLSLRAGVRAGHRAAVLELGMNHPGEIALLAGIAQPTVALVNNAQREHQEFMHSVEAVARENGAVLSALPLGGAAVFPAEDEYAPLWADLASGRRLWRFKAHVQMSPGELSGVSTSTGGTEPAGAEMRGVTAEVSGTAVWQQGHWDLSIESPAGRVQAAVHMPGRHNVHNAMAAASAALAAGVPLDAVAQGLSEFRAVAGRSMPLTLVRQGQPLTLIDDSYNANPDSVRAAIEVLAELHGPRLLILGDMGEVGEKGPAFHAEAGEHARLRGIEHLWCLGGLCSHTAAAFGEGAQHFGSMAELVAALAHAPDVQSILVKGSRFMRMEQAVKALQSIHGEAC